MKTPIDMTLDGITWTAVSPKNPSEHDDGLPYATHEGVFEIMGHKLRCYRLNTGQAVFDADDVEAFFQNAFAV